MLEIRINGLMSESLRAEAKDTVIHVKYKIDGLHK